MQGRIDTMTEACNPPQLIDPKLPVITPVIMMKGEGNDYSTNPHAVDGMSGATKTAVGVNEMLADYLNAYENFIKTKKTK